VAEQELDRLRRVVTRLMDAHMEAQEAARQGFGIRDTYEDSERIRERLEGALIEVRDILDGASEDVNEILRESNEVGEA
jgi:hypothetical protein